MLIASKNKKTSRSYRSAILLILECYRYVAPPEQNRSSSERVRARVSGSLQAVACRQTSESTRDEIEPLRLSVHDDASP